MKRTRRRRNRQIGAVTGRTGGQVGGERGPRWIMRRSLAIILILLWLLGLITSATMGGFIHVLLVIAVVMILVRIISGRRVL